MINEIKISNFRGIGNIELTGLKRVNLIVGDNNSGKTSLLEAIAAAANPGNLKALPFLFRADPPDKPDRYFKWLLASGANAGFVEIFGPNLAYRLRFSASPFENLDSYEQTMRDMGSLYFLPEEMIFSLNIRTSSTLQSSHESLIANFADAVRSPENEKRLECLLAKLDDRIRSARLDLIGGEQVISLDVGLPERLPLSQLGQGTQRIVTLLADLMGNRPDLFLVDEIENGIHYTALPKLWRGLAEIADALDIQIFATTHSRECVESAHRVFFDEDPEDARGLAVIQMLRVGDEIQSRVLDEERVNDALEIHLELR